MFGKDQPEIQNEEDVGHYVNSLIIGAGKELDKVLNSQEDEDNELAGGSEATTTGTQSKK